MRGAGVLGGLHLLGVGGFGGVLYTSCCRVCRRPCPAPAPPAPLLYLLPPQAPLAPYVLYRGTEVSECSGVSPPNNT